MSPPDSSPTLSDIAKQVGVSPMTVSRALRGSSNVKPETRQKIQQAAEAAGYLKRDKVLTLSSARSMKSGAGMRLVIPRLDRPGSDQLKHFNQVFVNGVRSRLQKIGGRVEYIGFRDIDDLETICDRLEPTGMVIRQRLPVAWVDRMKERLPVVSVMPCDIHHGVDTIYINEHRAAAHIQTYLRSLGHTRITWIGIYDTHAPCEVTPSSMADPHSLLDGISILASRYAAWSTYTTAQLPRYRQPFVLLEHDFNHEKTRPFARVVRDGLDQILDQRPQPTALVVPSLSTAQEIYPALRERGIRVPEDISLVTYALQSSCPDSQDDMAWGEAESQKLPDFTRISLDLEKVGRVIPELIERRVANAKTEPLSLQFEAPLIAGETTAPARQ